MATALREAAKASAPARQADGSRRYRVRVIESDRWGSSAYYPAEILARDAPSLVQPGLASFMDHPTLTEADDRPERSVRDLVGTFVSAGQVGEDGIYADLMVYPHWAQVIEAMRDDIGLSIRASGTVEMGEKAGQSGPILTALSEIHSVDWVTRAGAGGKVVALLESARARPLALHEGHGMTANDLRAAIDTALNDAYGGEGQYVWVLDYTDEWAVYQVSEEGDSDTYQERYTVGPNGVVTLAGSATEVAVRTTYTPITTPPEPATPREPTEPAEPATPTESAGVHAPGKGAHAPQSHTDKEPLVSGPQGTPPPSGDPKTTPVYTTTTNTPNAAPQIVEADGDDALKSKVDSLGTQLAEARRRLEERSDDRIMRAKAETALTETRRENAQLRAVDHARNQTAAALAESGLPAAAHSRVIAAVVGFEGKSIPLTESGHVDGDKLGAAINAAIDTERTYIASLAEAEGSGIPRGLGAKPGDPSAPLSEADFNAKLAGMFESIGLPSDRAALAAKGR